MLKISRKPYGYRELLVYKKAEELQKNCSILTSYFPLSSLPLHSAPFKTLSSLSDQMNRSARSVKQNIVEGWKRNFTREYYDFLGFSIAANSELEEDCDDIIKGIYPDLMGIMGVKGEKGERRTPSAPFSLSDIEKIPFYPLDPHLPTIVQLKLRCKELNFLVTKLQKSLGDKMGNEKTLATSDKLAKMKSEEASQKKFEEELARKYNLPSYN